MRLLHATEREEHDTNLAEYGEAFLDTSRYDEHIAQHHTISLGSCLKAKRRAAWCTALVSRRRYHVVGMACVRNAEV